MRSNIWYVLTTLDFKDRAALGGVCVHIFTLQFLPNLDFPFFSHKFATPCISFVF